MNTQTILALIFAIIFTLGAIAEVYFYHFGKRKEIENKYVAYSVAILSLGFVIVLLLNIFFNA